MANTNAVEIIQSEERAEKVLDLYHKGKTYRAISMQLGISTGLVADIMNELRIRRQERMDDKYDEGVQLHLERLEVMWRHLWEKAEKSRQVTKTIIDPESGKALRVMIEEHDANPVYVNALVKLADQLARVLGLYKDLKPNAGEGQESDAGRTIIIPIEDVKQLPPASSAVEAEVVVDGPAS